MMPLRRQGSRRRGPQRGLPDGRYCMDAIIPLTQGLFNLGADLLKRRRFPEGVRILRRLLETPDLSPTLAPEANQLLATVHYEHHDYAQMRRAAERALRTNPDNAEDHLR